MGWWDYTKDAGGRLANPLGNDHDTAPWWDPGGQLLKDPGAAAEKLRKQQLYGQAAAAGSFADQGQAGYTQLGNDAAAQRAYLGRLATGQDSVSAEQLRQASQQNISGQMSMAASANPQDAAGAARTAAIQAGRIGGGLAGQQAVAGLQERQSAQQALSNMIMQQRQQDLQSALQSRQNALTGYGAQNAGTPEKSNIEKYGGAITGILGAIASDRRLKQDIRPGDDEAAKATEGLRAYVYRYKDPRFGTGPQLGTTAQDLERAGLKQAVIDTPQGKVVDAGKLAGANTAMIAALGRRVGQLEQGSGDASNVSFASTPADVRRKQALAAQQQSGASGPPQPSPADVLAAQRRNQYVLQALAARAYPVPARQPAPDRYRLPADNSGAGGGQMSDLGGQ